MENTAVAIPSEKKQLNNLKRGLTAIYVIWLREFKRFWRDAPRRIGSFVQPLVYLFLLGTGLQAAFKVFGGGQTDYVTFMFPGIVAMTVLFTSVFSAISILWDREFGFLKEVLVSPVPRSSVALGKIVGGATTAFLQGLVLLVLAFFPNFFGFSLSTLGKCIALIPVIILLSLGMTSLGVAIAANMKSFEGFPIVMNFILLPMFFLSGAMFPLQGLPGWMEFLTKVNPLTYGVDLIRGIALRGVDIGGMMNPFQGLSKDVISKIPPEVVTALKSAMPVSSEFKAQAFPVWVDVLVLLGFSSLMLAIAIWQFSRQE